MDGGALLDSLADWTAESHPNVSLETRQHNNELMAEFRSELFTLLGSTTQVGGGSSPNCPGGILIVQPMDEALVRQLSPAELEYRLDLAEFGGQTGGGPNQLIVGGGDIEEAAKKVGFLKKLKIWTGIRNFNKFVDDFEKLRGKINKNMTAYETQLAQSTGITDALVNSIKNIFLYAKVGTMWEIMKTEDIATKGDVEKIKFDVLGRRIGQINLEIERYKIEAEKHNKIAQGVFKRKGGWFSGKTSIVDIMKKEVKKQSKAYMKLDAEMNYYVAEITKAKNLKLLEAAVSGKNIKELPRAQRRELAGYQKKRAKYEKMFAFDEVRRQEYETILSRKENLLIKLDFCNRTLAAGNYMTGTKNSKKAMDAALTTWKTAINTLYQDLNIAIAESTEFNDDLKKISGFIADNTNSVGKLIAGNPDFEVIRKEYEKYLEYAEKAQEYQEGIHNGLCSIKNKILELIPDKVLLQDMWIVSSGQGFVLRLVKQTMKDRQDTFGKDYNKGMKYFTQKILAMKGGSSGLPRLGWQKGGYHALTVSVPPLGFPTHGHAFYDHEQDGNVFNQTSGNYEVGATAPTARKSVTILTLPYGVRRITEEYSDAVNTAINEINGDELIYIPLLRHILGRNHIYILVAQKTDDSESIRVISAIKAPSPIAETNYNLISGKYYYYNIMDRAINGVISISITNHNINIGGTEYIILPVFYKYNTVDNDLFKYDEYLLLNPFLSCVMTATLKESDLTRNPPYVAAVPPGPPVHKGYDIVANMVAGGTNLNLKLELQKDHTTLANLKLDNCEYYYNFCGPNIIIKAENTTPTAKLFTTTNNSRMGGAPGGLQPAATINLNTEVNTAIFANYLFQITGHINELTNKINELTYSHSTIPPQFPIPFTSGTYDIDIKYSDIPYSTDTGTPPTRLPLQNRTLLNLLHPAKNWDGAYVKNIFGCADDDNFKYLLLSLKILIADIIFWASQTKDPKQRIIAATADPTTPLAQKLLKVAAAKAGLPVTAFTNPTAPGATTATGATGTGASLGLPSGKQKEALEYLKMAIPQTSNAGSYWKNLEEMDKIISKFSSQKFTDYNKRLIKIYDTMTDIKKFEDTILDIKPEIDKITIPGVDLIAKNLAVKPPENSKDAYTEAGTKLYEKLKQDKNYIAQNTFRVDMDNIVNVLDPVFHKIAFTSPQGGALLQYVQTITEFYSSPYSEYRVILSTKEGAEKLKAELEKSKYNGHLGKNINKIFFALMLLLQIGQDSGAYNIYKPGYDAVSLEIGQKKKNNKGKKRQTNKPKGTQAY